MGTSSLAATLDGKVIHCAYYRSIDVGDNVSPVDLAIMLKHQYVNSANIVNEITLEQFTISKEYLMTKGLLGVSDVEQTLEFHVLNLRYLKDLFIECREIRDGVPVLTRIPILLGDDVQMDTPLSSNPEKYPEHDENIPAKIPDMNISVQRTETGVLYSLAAIPLQIIQSSKRIYLKEEQGEQFFVELDYNQEDKLYIENSMTNLIPNAGFTGIDIPDDWEVDAPGIILNNTVKAGDIDNTQIWQIRASNPNLFNAFNNITLKTKEKNQLYSGLNYLTFSVYYRLKYDSEKPFENFHIKINFYNNDDYIRSEQIEITVSDELKTWELMSGTIQHIPITANKYNLELSISEIGTTELFHIEFYLPQLEALPCATTRSIDTRIQDKYITGSSFELNFPFYLLVKTHHITGQGTRGLCSSTTNQINGFEFLSSNDRLRFKWYDGTGNILLNIASDILNIQSNDIVNYGVLVTETTLNFYIDGILLSTHTHNIVIDQNQSYCVGSLEKSNTTINSELLDFKILRGYA